MTTEALAPLSRAWMEQKGWQPVSCIRMFEHCPDYIDADLCVWVSNKEWIVAKFHYMGDRATTPDAMPDTIEVTGLNSDAEIGDADDIDLTQFYAALVACQMHRFPEVRRAVGAEEKSVETLLAERLMYM